MAMAFVEFENVSKIYKTGEVEISALHDASFTVEQGEICVIVGASGAGKTTLLNILGGMDTLTSGTVKLDGRDISRYNRRQLTEYRRRDVGFVFQFYNLIQNLTALENVEIAAQLCEHPLDAAEVLREVGLQDRLARLCHGQEHPQAAAGHLPPHEDDRRHHYAQLRPNGDGRPRHLHQKRHDPVHAPQRACDPG